MEVPAVQSETTRDIGPADRPIVAHQGRLSLGSFAMIAAYGLTLLLINFGRPWTLTFHEVNFAGPAREFLHSGDWLVPRIMGIPIWDKPPLMHWSIAASMAVFGSEAEWVARLPAMLSAVLTSLILARLAARWYGDQVGLLAGLIQASSIYVFMQGRLAEADMLLCAIVTMAMAAFAAGVLDREASRPPMGWRLAFFGAAGLAFLVKGPIGPALVASGSGLFAIVERKRAAWRMLLDPIGWALMLVLILAWPVAAMFRDSGLLEVWWRHNVERFSGDLSGGGKDPVFYLYTAAWLALPWTPLAVFGAIAHLRGASEPSEVARGRLLLCWTAGMLLVLSLSAWKHKHYIIPALPPLSIWAALGLSRILSGRVSERVRRWPVGRFLRWTMPPTAVAGMAAGIILSGSGSGLTVAAGFLAGVVGLGLTVAERLWSRGKSSVALIGVFAAAWGAFVLVQSLAMPEVDDYRGQSELAVRLSRTLPPGADISVLSIPDPQVTYYLPIPVQRHDEPRSLANRLLSDMNSENKVVYVVGPQLMFAELQRLGKVRILDRAATIHPRKGEPDRMIAVELRPDRHRIASRSNGRSQRVPGSNGS